jgi:hypothetical protein
MAAVGYSRNSESLLWAKAGVLNPICSLQQRTLEKFYELREHETKVEILLASKSGPCIEQILEKNTSKKVSRYCPLCLRLNTNV